MTYANGFAARYEYDNLDRVSKIYQTENNTETLTYQMIYNGEGDLYELRNFRTNRASFFEYDHAGRCMASKERSFSANNEIVTGYGAILSSYGYQYDECNNLTKLTCSVTGSIWNTVYTYDNDNRPKTTTLNSGKVITNTYDAIGRLSKRTIGLSTPYETRFEYHLNGSNRTPLLHKYYNGSDDPFVYNYDDNGNITSITQGSTSITYKYDVANRLTRENNSILNQTITYEYDYYGNIQSKKTYAYSTGDLTNATYTEIEYEYETDGWNDQLVSYNDQAIEYDEMGNPTTYRGYTMTWRGKQLTSASNGTDTLTFEYNEDGLRQKKTVNNVVTDYFYNGSVLIGMQRGTMKFLFSYDAAGNVVSVKFNGTEYYYLRNAQGDIVKLIDASGAVVVEYTYDTWGKKVTTTGSLAGTLGLFQPFRYRGYVYDWETGFYYLQSRYYDPTTGRFISADVLLSTGQGVMGHDCYAYCLGNPVNMADDGGSAARDLYLVSERDGSGYPLIPNSPPKVIIFTLPEFEYESLHYIHNKLGCSKKEIRVISFSSSDELKAEWDKLCNPNVIVIINAHGNYKGIGFSDDLFLDREQVLSFKRVPMRTLVLLACNCGQIDKASNNIADAFAFIVDAPVYAADGEVKNRTFWSHDGDTQKGWYEYRGGRGIYSSAGDGYLNWEDIYGSN